jgi:L-ascorbate metabolism protein UlaG (beta-lactamase superfamily)
MKVTLLGHASLVVEAGDTVVWMDPVFKDPFHDGVVVSCPKRDVHPDRIPLPDAVFISHVHTDHYDEEAISRARSRPFYCPPDPDLVRVLRAHGARDIRTLDDMKRIELGALTIVATPSRSRHERGALFMADGASVWNLVDTAIDHDICADVLDLIDGRLDVAFCGYQPLLEYAALWQSEDTFPRARYDRLVECALATRARVVVPGSAGLAAPPRLEWVNPRIFPATREMFMHHLHDVAPEVTTLRVDPGEGVEVAGDRPPKKFTTTYATLVDDDEARRLFDPVGHPPPPLKDENPDRTPEIALRELVDDLLGDLPAALARARHHSVRGPIRTIIDRRAVVEIRIALPSETRVMHVAGWFPDVKLVSGPHPDPDYTFAYVSSVLFRYVHRGIFEEPMCAARRRAVPPDTHDAPARPYRLSTLDPARLNGRDLTMVVDDRWNWSILSLLDD